tara:strand:+ start:349 stop:585 length:237 start_codon:yes stop_codon:yes gene_type:complete
MRNLGFFSTAESLVGNNRVLAIFKHVADRRLERIWLAKQYGSTNPFPWMSETMDLAKEKNFFETRVTEYQSAGSLSWD